MPRDLKSNSQQILLNSAIEHRTKFLHFLAGRVKTPQPLRIFSRRHMSRLWNVEPRSETMRVRLHGFIEFSAMGLSTTIGKGLQPEELMRTSPQKLPCAMSRTLWKHPAPESEIWCRSLRLSTVLQSNRLTSGGRRSRTSLDHKKYLQTMRRFACTGPGRQLQSNW